MVLINLLKNSFILFLKEFLFLLYVEKLNKKFSSDFLGGSSSIFFMFASLAENGGFGINTNLLETNVLNLAVVIGVLFYFGKDLLLDTLKNRKELILKSLQDSVEKKMEAVDNLNAAKIQFQKAQEKSEEIRSQGLVLARQNSEKFLDSMEGNVKRIEEAKIFTIRFEEEKAITEVVQKVSSSALEQALDKLTVSMNPSIQKRIFNRNIDLFKKSS